MTPNKPHIPRNMMAVAVGLAFVAGMSAIPSATTALLRSIHDDGRFVDWNVEDQTDRAIQDRAERRQRERQYWDAVDVYYTLLDEGVITKHELDINKPQTFMQYLSADYVQALRSGNAHPSAIQSDIVDETELPALERDADLIEGFVDLMGFCPKSLLHTRNPRLGTLYDICTKLLTQRKKVLLNSAGVHGAAPRARKTDYQSLQRRLDLFSESIQGARRRAQEDGNTPSTRDTRP